MQGKLTEYINEIVSKKGRAVIAIDGRCGSGKTTLADSLAKVLDAQIVHMDHFFLRPEQRCDERLADPGENIDHERFLSEVLIPISEKGVALYRPFDCKTLSLGDRVQVGTSPVIIVEGSYSCHEKLWEYYDLHVFMDVGFPEQLKRIERRNGKEALKTFENKWIPLEEAYFEKFCIKEKCEFYLKSCP